MTNGIRKYVFAAGLSLALSGAGCVKEKHTPIEQIPQLTTLKDVMDNQATTSDPLFKKRAQTSFTDAEFAAFVDGSARVEATSRKIKDFSKGPGFDQLAEQLTAQDHALGEAARAKDAVKVAAALTDMKTTCHTCHSKYR